MSTETLSLKNLERATQRDIHGRDEAEAEIQAAAAPSGTARRKTGRTHQILWRATPAEKELLQRLADRLSIGQIEKVSYSTVMGKALEALEEKLKGGAA